ncbi:GNAT family N-acetyltransferase [Clostridium estertheticum]|uniref:GNAT family N-acetyltransferase n=1 Tax=Clostridium estertheticum TaxID=238834 RepID=A0AA47EE87_9CLOT|nr:GNAT family N-acetyltransferase [Clostridium estertheticum]MBU3153946.1 GNAT family N-acetyltransferase [Clostridium estertheticum]MBU3199309.1 GNAT family N-acetyltransferase [Clostridium estertheticum]WAG58517.1 GNAT family N-acetyltransferase [Clostridium estertheticum]WAG67445.1 GNAT family N-acetyltransferase [Clostridium estertheticum]
MDSYNHTICMKLKLDEEDNKAVRALCAICYEKQKTCLKLELDLKKRQRKETAKDGALLEFLYYENKTLVGYLGVCNFGGNSVQISGMVHPDFRRKGIFRKLYLMAKEEWQRISKAEVLALCDHTSTSGIEFINSIGGEYGTSEYKMCLTKKALDGESIHKHENATIIKLKLATSEDVSEIENQTSIYFGKPQNEIDGEEVKVVNMDKEDLENSFIQQGNNFISYMALLKEEIIGKVHISIINKEGFIYGFGVLPVFRGKGYGRKILLATLDILKEKGADNIFLEVESQNKNAIGLYESCGFEEVSVMDYYVII